MAPARPMLDDVELQQVQEIEVAEGQVLVQHPVPALEGDFLQRLAQAQVHDDGVGHRKARTRDARPAASHAGRDFYVVIQDSFHKRQPPMYPLAQRRNCLTCVQYTRTWTQDQL